MGVVRTHDVENKVHLLDIVVAGEQRLAPVELGHNATHRPKEGEGRGLTTVSAAPSHTCRDKKCYAGCCARTRRRFPCRNLDTNT